MTVYVSNLVIHTGTDFTQTFVFEDEVSNSALDLTGYSGSGVIRRYDSSSKAADFTLDFGGSSQRETGRLTISMTESITKDIKPGKYFYDIRLESAGGRIEKVVEGVVTVKQSVTRI
tara:strand:- start:259 stop:609 length:351 start_codon:yes stop_codon:yes gene_type:complete